MPPRKTTRTTRKYNWNNRNKTARTWNRTNRANTTTTTYPINSPRFSPAKHECQWRIGSYRNVYSQFTGAGKTFFSPTNANKWLRYINNGGQVYKFNNKDFCRYFGSQWTQNTPRAAFRYLKQRFGSTIKDVTRGKANCWLVATSKPPMKGPFTNYNWK